MKNLVEYIERVGIALSVLFNVILGGYSNQTFSARNWDWKRQNKPNLVLVINFIFNDAHHCMESWVYWKVRKEVSDGNNN